MSLTPHAVKKRGVYLPAYKRKQTVPPFNIGRQHVTIIRGRAFSSRDEAIRCAAAAIQRGAGIERAPSADTGASR